MQLCQLFSPFSAFKFGSKANQDISLVTADSRMAEDHSVFVAVRGISFDGHSAVEELTRKYDLAGLVVEDDSVIPEDYDGAVLRVEDSKEAFHVLAARFQGRPADSMFNVGITGTNGKTTVTYLVEAILNQHGLGVGVMGTIDHHYQSKTWQSQLTTPNAFLLHQRIREFKDLGAKALAMEVSSHALDQKRVGEIPFSAAVFTNLSRDHLDYHQSMDDYFHAKELLFSEYLKNSKRPVAVINGDDEWGKKLKVASNAMKVYFGFASHDVQIVPIDLKISGSKFKIVGPDYDHEFVTPMIGEFNLLNCCGAILVGLHAGVSLEECAHALANFQGVPGRLERVASREMNVFVDYAHTPDALSKVLKTLNAIKVKAETSSKTICVFGCGGDRDSGKRAEMGQIASENSDLIVVTSDNPRSEDPHKIIDDILQGLGDETSHYEVEVDRRKAIEKAISLASPGDIILIAGKGHEDYQIIGDETLDFDDRKMAKEILDGR